MERFPKGLLASATTQELWKLGQVFRMYLILYVAFAGVLSYNAMWPVAARHQCSMPGALPALIPRS